MKTITAVFHKGSKRITASDSLTQWDYGQQLYIEGLELPYTFEVDFSLDPNDGIADPAIGTDYTVRIPDTLIEAGKQIYAFVFLHEDSDDGETVYRITIPVEKRPARGTKDPDPVEQSVITQTISALNAAADRAAEQAQAAEAAKETILGLSVEANTLEPGAEATVEKQIDGETGEITFVFGIPEGMKGNPGEKGDTGAVYTPSVINGVLTWANNGDLENPVSFDIVAAVLAQLPRAEEGRF